MFVPLRSAVGAAPVLAAPVLGAPVLAAPAPVLASPVLASFAAPVLAAPVLAAILLAAAVLAAAPAAAQSGCTERPLADPPRTAYDCGGILIEREAAAAMGLPVADIAAGTPTATLERGAMLVSVPAGGGFQVRTPHAIASVRGTTFIVDVSRERTSVFVTDGTVQVSAQASTATLRAGDGVDVPAGAAVPPRRGVRVPPVPLTVNRWGAQRAAALLARFGR